MIFYKMILSGKNNEIRIDEEELPGILNSLKKGGFILCKQGMFNPSYVISIVEDQERWHEWNESADRSTKLHLDNIFSEEKLLQILSTKENKKLL